MNSGISMSENKTKAGVSLAYDLAKVKVIDFEAVSDSNAVACLIAKDTRLHVVITYAPTENCSTEYMQHLQELKEACKLRSSKVKSSSEFQLLILDPNATLGKEMHKHLPKQMEDSFLKRVAEMVNS